MAVQKGLISVLAAPMIDPAAGRIDMFMTVGSTIADIVRAALPDLQPAELRFCRVALVSERGSIIVPAEHWRTVRPREGVRVVIRLIPGKNALKAILQIVVSIAAVALGQFWGVGLAGTFGLGAQAWAGIIGLGVSVIGNLLINALIPPPKQETLEAENRYTITGWRNRLEPDGAVPLVLGTVRYAPPFGAYTYTEIVGDWQYLVCMFCFGYGPLTLSGFRIGDTDIAEYDEVEMQVRDGRQGDAPLSLFPRQVVEESIGTELLMPLPRNDLGEVIEGGAATEERVVRTTGGDASGASVILAWPAGLLRYNDDGKAKAHVVRVRIEQRPIDAENWQQVTVIEVNARKLEAFYRQHTWDFPTRGRWQVACTMLTPETTDTKIQQRTTWAALQTIRPEYPLNFPHPLALVSLRVKATHQLNGQLDNFNALVSRPCLDYEHTTGQWIERVTSNPASLYRHVLQSPSNPKAASDSAIDLEALADWHDFCRLKGLKYDRAIEDKATTLRDLLTEIAAAGRASRRHDGLKWTVTIDRPDKMLVDHISPRNSYDFRGSRSYVEPPDGFRVQFLDATNDFKAAERIVPWPGKEGAEMRLVEALDMPGKVWPDEIYREARRRMYEAMHRPDVYTVSQDGPIRVATRGDLVHLSSDVINRVQVAARIKSVSGRLIEIDDTVTMEAGKSYAIRFRTGLSEEDTIGVSVVRTVVTVAGERSSFVVNGEGDMPLAGELLHFGEASTVDYALVVTDVEAGEDFSSHLRLIDAAPVIDQLVDAEDIPAWSGRSGTEIDQSGLFPPAPRFTSIRSGISGTGEAARIDYLIEPGSGAVGSASFEIDHRQIGTTVWNTITIPAANGGGSLTAYPNGTGVHMRARAFSSTGTPGPYNSVVAFIVGEDDTPLPGGLPEAMIDVTALLGGAVVQFATSDNVNTARVQLYRSTSAVLDRANDAAGLLLVEPSRSYSVAVGDATRQNLLVNGAMDDTGTWTLGTGWEIDAGRATKAVGSASAISQPLATAEGAYFRLAFTLSDVTAGNITPRLTGGTTVAGVARSASGTFSDRIQAVSGNSTFGLNASSTFAGALDDIVVWLETATCLVAGTHYFWLEPQNADGVAGPVSGPFTVTIR
ncbi:phage tail protein [Rhizobium pusense]|uniref:TipJ family phage tail tip protein n=1 Tax=Agrobacterium pusense TaxID=648995 RepID=UPI002448511C|nr:phage tail protein [Agrobacterium pusense]MDH1094730.1 phage tail protein [Agrobacterium pusense]MDH1111345.1 phage tail protein [Agrobacterium pusense]MDH2192710.1 phage tail protein [Agrobacterium pusense]